MSFSKSMRELEQCEIDEVSGGGYIADVFWAGAAILAVGAAVLAAPVLGGAMLGAAAVYGTASAVMALGGAVAELSGY
ncbi:MAG: hypothetical protein EPN49_02395 [Rhodanobacter sp.]|nr:MAG: hypothetical protein EPN49_02395 [Rhodanobacter sp.]